MIVRKIQDGDMEIVMAHPKQSSLKVYPDLTAPDDAVVVINNGEIVAVGGVKVLWEGVGEAWVIVADQSDKDSMLGVEAFNTMRFKLEEMIHDNKLRRVEVQARLDFPDAIRFILLLGFEQECVRKYYAPDGADMILFSKVYDEYI